MVGIRCLFPGDKDVFYTCMVLLESVYKIYVLRNDFNEQIAQMCDILFSDALQNNFRLPNNQKISYTYSENGTQIIFNALHRAYFDLGHNSILATTYQCSGNHPEHLVSQRQV